MFRSSHLKALQKKKVFCYTFIKLNEVEIQPFDGKSDLWSEFYDNFQCAIYQTSLLNDIQKNDIFEKLS